MAEETKQGVKVPEAPAVLPPAEKEAWKKSYSGAFEESQEHDADAPESAHHGFALRVANRMLSVPKLKSLEDAARVPAWKILKRVDDAVKGVVKIVTIDGRKYSFDKSAKKADEGSGNGGAQPQGAAKTA